MEPADRNITSDEWFKTFKNGLSKICGRQPLSLQFFSANFTWFIPEYLGANEVVALLLSECHHD